MAFQLKRDSGASPIQLKIISVPKGTKPDPKWTYLYTSKGNVYYDDGEPEPEVATLAPTRDKVTEIDSSGLSDIEESDTEIDFKTKGACRVYRVNGMRDALKLKEQILKKNTSATFGVRMGGNTILRLTGAGSQFKVQTVSENALVQSDGTQGTGFMPPREKTDPAAHGSLGSYEHVFSELRNHKDVDVALAMYNKYMNNVDYPVFFSERAKAKLDEALALLTIAEPYRSPYAYAIFVATIQAIHKGAITIEQAYYEGQGQIKALHAGASSHKTSGVSGQLMEQNLGLGVNSPHPTQSSMSLSPMEWKDGLKRTVDLFGKASAGTDVRTMLDTNMLAPFSIGMKGIDSMVQYERSAPYGTALISVKLKPGKKLTPGEKVLYKKKQYTVKNITASGWVNLY